MQDQKRKLVVLISSDTNDDKSSVGFTIANAALSTGTEVAVFLTSNGVELSRHGSSEMTQVRPLKPLSELIDQFIEKGGLVWACSPCFQHRGLDTEKVYDKVVVTGAGPLIEWIQAGAATLSL